MPIPLLLEAARYAISDDPEDKRNFLLGAIGIRERDNKLVKSRNGAVSASPDFLNYKIVGECHAEARVLQKLGKGGVIYVSRVLKKDRSLAMARPCSGCQLRIRAAGVKKVFYSVNDFQYGCWFSEHDVDYIRTVRRG